MLLEGVMDEGASLTYGNTDWSSLLLTWSYNTVSNPDHTLRLDSEPRSRCEGVVCIAKARTLRRRVICVSVSSWYPCQKDST